MSYDFVHICKIRGLNIMEYKTLISIGELARICNVSHKTLRHYDSIGVLEPIKVNLENGYRYYAKWQITRIMLIRELQSLGISLAEIKMCLKNDHNNPFHHNLKDIFEIKEIELNEQLLILHENIQKIHDFKLQYEKLEKILKLDRESKVIIKELPKRKIVYKKYSGKYDPDVFRLYYKKFDENSREKGYIDSKVSSFPMAIYYPPFDLSNITIKIGYEIDKDSYVKDFDIDEIAKAYYATYIYKGNYTSLRNDTYKYIYKFIQENGYQADGPIIEIYLISEIIADKQDCFITEIQIPVKKS